MANYALTNSNAGTQQVMSGSYKSLLIASASNATALKRIRLYECTFGTNGTPADNEMEYDISRQTVVGTATTLTANAIDSADGAAVGAYAANATVEGTVTAGSSVFYKGVNQRSTYRWQADGSEAELVVPATNANGLVLRARSAAYTGTATCDAYIRE